MSDREESRLLIGLDAPYSDSDADDYEAEGPSRAAPTRKIAPRPYRDDEYESVETAAKYYRAPRGSRQSGGHIMVAKKTSQAS
jgi:hypothetical protein